MKQNLKNSLWVIVTSAVFISFIIAIFGIQLHVNYTSSITGKTMSDTTSLKMILDAKEKGYTGFLNDVAGLWISGLVFSAIIMVLTFIKFGLDLSNKSLKINEKIIDYTLMGLVGFTTLLMLSAAGVAADNIKAPTTIDGGYGFALFLFSFIIPLVLIPLPVVLPKMMNKKAAKKATFQTANN